VNQTNIEWADWTWNPITGCSNTCPYCYARRNAKRFHGGDFRPRFHPDRLSKPFEKRWKGKEGIVFTCSMGEFWDDKIDPIVREQVIHIVNECPEKVFVFLTKRPENIDLTMPRNAIVGVSVDGSAGSLERIGLLDGWPGIAHRLLCFEPLLHPVRPASLKLSRIDWMIIGGQTQPNRRPEQHWVRRLVEEARVFHVPVFVKPNAGYGTLIREFPEIELEV